MGKQAKPQSVRNEQNIKAGKKKHFKEPPAKNPFKEDARIMGDRQFIADHQLSVKDTKIVFDKNTQQFVTKLVDVPVPFIWDETRKHFVYSPAVVEKDHK